MGRNLHYDYRWLAHPEAAIIQPGTQHSHYNAGNHLMQMPAQLTLGPQPTQRLFPGSAPPPPAPMDEPPLPPELQDLNFY